jgi:hypothetical protein
MMPLPLERSALDLTRYHFRRELGDITVFGTWWLPEDSGPIPCLVLFPTHVRAEEAVPCVVMIADAWRWSEAIGNPADCARQSFRFAQMLRLDTSNISNVFLVRSLIHDHLQDLLTMPPMPSDMRETVVLGEAKVTDHEGGQTIRHEEMIVRV